MDDDREQTNAEHPSDEPEDRPPAVDLALIRTATCGAHGE